VKISLKHDMIILDPEDAAEDRFLVTQMDSLFQEFDLMFHRKVPTQKTAPGITSAVSRMLNEWLVKQAMA